MSKQDKTVRYRLVAKNQDGRIAILIPPTNLIGLISALKKNNESWYDQGWEDMRLEDDTYGCFSFTIAEHITDMLDRKEITFPQWCELKFAVLV